MRYLGPKVQGPVAWRNIGPGLCFNSPVSVGVLRPSGLAPPLPVRVSLRPLPCCEGWQEWPAGCAPGQHQRQGRQEPGEEGEQMSSLLFVQCLNSVVQVYKRSLAMLIFKLHALRRIILDCAGAQEGPKHSRPARPRPPPGSCCPSTSSPCCPSGLFPP